MRKNYYCNIGKLNISRYGNDQLKAYFIAAKEAYFCFHAKNALRTKSLGSNTHVIVKDCDVMRLLRIMNVRNCTTSECSTADCGCARQYCIRRSQHSWLCCTTVVKNMKYFSMGKMLRMSDITWKLLDVGLTASPWPERFLWFWYITLFYFTAVFASLWHNLMGFFMCLW